MGATSDARRDVTGPLQILLDRAEIQDVVNRVALLSDALAPEVRAPTLFIHSDGSALPDNVRAAHDTLGGPAHVFWTVGDHFDFYDREPWVTLSADVAVAFLRTVL